MRIWSLHPRYLDRPGLTAAWREGLLAQAVLAGRTRGYRHHPQLLRLRAQPAPLAATSAYLLGLAEEGRERGYRFDVSLVEHAADAEAVPRIPVTEGQVAREWWHLVAKLAVRSPDRVPGPPDGIPSVHPLFVVVPGPVEDWERTSPGPNERA